MFELLFNLVFFTLVFAIVYLGVEYTGRYVDRKREIAERQAMTTEVLEQDREEG